ncbi:MAG: pyruvate kinase [Firmicutes bacterium]|nr:pyruvate kinase [Bacillota bacterium]
MKATKIVCTLGPASSGPEVMRQMLQEGMNVARLNCSHGSHEEHQSRIDTFRQVCKELDVPAAILLDTKGPEIRLGTFEEDKVWLEKGQPFVLRSPAKAGEAPGTKEGVSISYGGLASEVEIGTRILVDDGKIRMEVEEVRDGDILCRVRDAGFVSTKKGVNVPDVHLNMEFLSERDQADLLFGIDQEVDFVAASFVRTVEDVQQLRSFLEEHGGREIRIISKIENPEGIRNFEGILEASDGIMIARGDMGVEVDYATLPGIQKSFIDQCNRRGKPVITATQMLESMISEPTPTRAEITDVANAVFDGTSAVMLSGETAAGQYPAQTVRAMSRIVTQAQQDLLALDRGDSGLTRRGPRAYQDYAPGEADVSTAIGHAACQAAADIGAKALIAITCSGYTARMMARFHPAQPIIAATPSPRAARQMALIRGVMPVLTRTEEDFDALVDAAVDGARQLDFLTTGDRVVISAGLPLNTPGNTNMIRVMTV